MATEWLKNFVNSLERLIDKPPYLLFVFIGSIFVVISLLFKSDFEQTWIFFIYAVGGTIWRYAEKDLMGPLIQKLSSEKPVDKKYSSCELYIRTIYHLGNLALFIAFLHYLNFV